MGKQKRFSAGNTFGEGEVQVMEYIVNTMLRGGDPRQAIRHKDFASICRKVLAMKESIRKQKAEASE